MKYVFFMIAAIFIFYTVTGKKTLTRSDKLNSPLTEFLTRSSLQSDRSEFTSEFIKHKLNIT